MANRTGADDTSRATGITDAQGNADVFVSTRDQTGRSTLTAADTANINTTSPGNIDWLPAIYEKTFLVTCYAIALESDHLNDDSRTNVCGLPPNNSYKRGFLRDTVRQGTGLALNGQYVHYNSHTGCYNLETCPRTATGVCATDGTTIAVDPAVIPRRSTVNVTILGQRKAQDGGEWINEDHIDDFMGTRYQECVSLGGRRSTIHLINY